MCGSICFPLAQPHFSNLHHRRLPLNDLHERPSLESTPIRLSTYPTYIRKVCKTKVSKIRTLGVLICQLQHRPQEINPNAAQLRHRAAIKIARTCTPYPTAPKLSPPCLVFLQHNSGKSDRSAWPSAQSHGGVASDRPARSWASAMRNDNKTRSQHEKQLQQLLPDQSDTCQPCGLLQPRTDLISCGGHNFISRLTIIHDTVLLTLDRFHIAKMGYEDSVYLAKLAEQAERYEGTLHEGCNNSAT